MKVATTSITVIIAATALLLLSACSVSVNDKDKKNEKVDIQTPFANLKVDSSDKAVNNGIPVYPGAKLRPADKDGDNHSANINLGAFGFGLKVIAAEYETGDSPDKVKAFYESGWAKRWERVLSAVAAVPGAEGNALLERLVRAHKDISDDHAWMRTILSRGTAESVLLYVDLFIGRVLGTEPHGVGAWQAGRQLAAYVDKFPELKPELKKRYETIGNGPGRRMLESFFSEVASQDDLVAMVKKYAANNQGYDGEMARAIRAVAVDEVLIAEGSNAYNIYPAPVGELRKALFDLLSGSSTEAELARWCLIAIDELRDEYGIAADDKRHPDVMSGQPWPPEAETK